MPQAPAAFQQTVWNPVLDPTTVLRGGALLAYAAYALALDFKLGQYRQIRTRTNVNPYSQQFSQHPVKTNLTVTDNASTAPDGTSTASTVTISAVGYNLSTSSITVTPGTLYTASVWLKLGTATSAFYSIYNNTGSAFFVGATAYPQLSSGAWTRVQFQFTTPAGCTGISFSWLRDGGAGSTGTISMWGGQIETAPVASAYIPTTSAAASVTENVLVTAPQRNNLFQWSNDYTQGIWSKFSTTISYASAIAAPSGDPLALVTETSSAGTSVDQIVSSAGGLVTASFVFKRSNHDWLSLAINDTGFTSGATGWYNIATGTVGSFTNTGGATGATGSIVNLGNGYYRCSLTGTVPAPAGTLRIYVVSANADASATRAGINSSRYQGMSQVETGSVATPYIGPTDGSMTRCYAGGAADLYGYSFSRSGAEGNLNSNVGTTWTNLIPNSAMAGATNSTLPTGWVWQLGSGITESVVGTGVENGLNYVDLSFVGTNASGAAIYPSTFLGPSNAAPALNGQTFTFSTYYRVVGGSTAGTFASLVCNRYNSSLSYLGGTTGLGLTNTSVLQRAQSTFTISDATNAYIQPVISLQVANGVSINLVLRIYGPQLELASAASPYVPTTSAPASGSSSVTTLGSELVTNGGFDGVPDGTDVKTLSGWGTAYSTPTTTDIQSGTLRIVANGANQGARYNLSGLTAGKIYQFSSTYTGAGAANVYLGSANVTLGSTGTFVAAGATETLFLRVNGNSAGTGYYDNISVKEVVQNYIDYQPAGFPAIEPGIGYWSRGAMTNLLTYSQQIDNAAWTKNAPAATITANSVTAPDGTITMDRIVTTTAGAEVFQRQTLTVAPYTLSCFFKADGSDGRFPYLALGGGSNAVAWFDLQNGVVGSITGASAVKTSGIQSLGNGIYRCWLTANGTTTNDPYVAGWSSGNGVFTLTNNVTGGYVWQMQLVAGSQPGPIILTTSATATVGADVLQFVPPDLSTDQDFAFWAVVNFDAASATASDIALLGNSSSNAISLYRDPGSVLSAISISGGVSSILTGPTVTTGRVAILFRRRAGKNTLATKNASTVAVGTESGAVAYPVSLAAAMRVANSLTSGTQPNGRVEFVGIRKGTFSDADITAILTGA